MKKLLLLLLLLLLYNWPALAQQKKVTDNFTVKGSIPWRDNRPIWLRYLDSNGKVVQLKTYVKKGKFIFSGHISSPTNFEFSDQSVSPHNFNGNCIANYTNDLFLSPGIIKALLQKNIFDPIKITGSAMQDDWDHLQKQKAPLYKLKDSLRRATEIISRKGNTPKNHADVMALGEKVDICDRRERQIAYNFITTHPAAYLSPYLTEYYFDGLRNLQLNTAEKYYKTFTPSVKNSVAGRKLEKELTKRRSSSTGGTAPLFKERDIDGKYIDLKSFRGKNYVILYFWASFSVGREGLFLKHSYQRYHDNGLEIICISGDFFDRDWKKGIVKDSTTMLYHLKEHHDLFTAYDINGTPPSYLFLIDKTGKVIGRYMGQHPTWENNGDNEGSVADLDKKLNEIFGR